MRPFAWLSVLGTALALAALYAAIAQPWPLAAALWVGCVGSWSLAGSAYAGLVADANATLASESRPR